MEIASQSFFDPSFGPVVRPVLLFIFLAANMLAGFLIPGRRKSLPLLWRLFGYLAAGLERRLNRPRRSKMTRAVRGFLFAAVLIFLSFLLGRFVEMLALYGPLGWLAQLLLLSLCVSVAIPARALLAMAGGLRNKDMAGVWKMLESLTPWQERTGNDIHAPARASVIFAAWAFNYCVIGPVFWFLLLGAGGMCLYVAVCAADRTIAWPGNRKAPEFWKSNAVFDDILNYIPARLCALMTVLGAMLVSAARPRSALKEMLAQNSGRSLNMGLCLSAFAGAVGVSLKETPRRGGHAASQSWLGGKRATAKAQWQDVRTAAFILMASFLVLLCGLAGLSYFVIKF